MGITDPEQLIGLTRAAAQVGISTTTIGFGQGYDEDLLRGMADGGRGATYYIERTDQALGVFEEELEGLLSLAAQNIRVSIRPGRDADFVRVVHQYPNHSEADVLTIDVGDLYAREPRRVLMEFLLRPEASEAEEAEVAEVTLAAHVLTRGGGVELHTITLPITLSPEKGGRVDATVRKEIMLLEVAQAREAALEAQQRGDFRAGSALLSQAIVHLEAVAPGDAALTEELQDLRAMESTFRADEVSEGDVKYMKQRIYESHRSRDSAKERIRRTGEE